MCLRLYCFKMAAVRAFCRPSYSAIALYCGKKLAVVKRCGVCVFPHVANVE